MSFDLDKVIAESESVTPFTFTFDGAEYSMPPDVDVEVLDLLGDGHLAEGLEVLLGKEQWAALVASPKLLGAVALGELVSAYMDHLGLAEGESTASRRSSKSTAGPSKRTSKGSTGSGSVRSEQLT